MHHLLAGPGAGALGGGSRRAGAPGDELFDLDVVEAGWIDAEDSAVPQVVELAFEDRFRRLAPTESRPSLTTSVAPASSAHFSCWHLSLWSLLPTAVAPPSTTSGGKGIRPRQFRRRLASGPSPSPLVAQCAGEVRHRGDRVRQAEQPPERVDAVEEL
jgi:hypothetical protein